MKAYIYLTLLFLALLLAGYFFHGQLGIPVSSTAVLLLIFFWLQACFSHSINASSLKKEGRDATVRLMLSVVFRFLSSGIFILILMYIFPDNLVYTIITFLFLFILFAGAEILVFNDAMKKCKL